MAALLTGCPSPGGGGNPGQTYTTIVSGRVTTPAGKAVTQYDTATRLSVLEEALTMLQRPRLTIAPLIRYT